MTVVQYEAPPPLPATTELDEQRSGPVGRVARLRGAAEYANYVANTALVPEALRGKADEVAAVILTGEEVGLEPMAALRSVAMIAGVPHFRAESLRGLVVSRGHELWVEESTVTRAIVAGRRGGSDRVGRVTWTMDDAKRANLAGKPNWRAYPREMLVARATAALVRQMFADVVLGLVAAEELDEYELNGAAPQLEAAPPEDVEKPKPAARTRRRAARQPAAAPAASPPPEPARPPVTPTPPPDEQPEPEGLAELESTDAQRRQIFALFRDAGLAERDEQVAFVAEAIGRTVASRSELSFAEASTVIDALRAAEKPQEGGEQAEDEPPAPEAPSSGAPPETPPGLLVAEVVERLVDAARVTVSQVWRVVAQGRGKTVAELASELEGYDAEGLLRVAPLIAALADDEAEQLGAWLVEVEASPPAPQGPGDLPEGF
jgi:hypothetical protein